MAKGSIEKRGERSWRLTVEAGFNIDGTRGRQRKSVTINDPHILKSKKRTNEYLENELAKFRMEVEAGQYIQVDKITFSDFVEKEYSKYLNKLSPNTIDTYLGHLNHMIIPALGTFQLGSIKTLQCVNYMESLNDYSVSTRLCHYSILKSIFKQAVKWKVIKENPMIGVDRPKGNTRSKRYYDSDQAATVLELLQNESDRWKLFFTACILGGFRRGELSAIEWTDIDFDNNTFIVRKSLAAGQIIKAPKTEDSIRVVVMPEWFMNDLKKYKVHWELEKEDMGDKWEGDSFQYVFHNGKGLPHHRTVPSQRWKEFTTKYNLPHIRLHDLRHTSATILLEEGVSIKVIQERHGHADYQTTANTYSHVTKKLAQHAVDKLEKFRPQSVPN